jgi:hypothetical protein
MPRSAAGQQAAPGGAAGGRVVCFVPHLQRLMDSPAAARGGADLVFGPSATRSAQHRPCAEQHNSQSCRSIKHVDHVRDEGVAVSRPAWHCDALSQRQRSCLRRVGPPALRPGRCLRRPGLPALDPGSSGMPRPNWRPAAHHRPPDRVRLVQVVRPVGRSTWTRRTRPGRTDGARRDASAGTTARLRVTATLMR